MIHPFSETIPPEPDIVQPEVDPAPISSLPENLNLEVEKPKFVPPLIIPQFSVAIESPISHSQPLEIYFVPDGEIHLLGFPGGIL